MIVGIDATRNRSGGAKAHLIGLLDSVNPTDHRVDEVHVWAYQSLLDSLPDAVWLKKHHSNWLERSLIHQMIWQIFWLPKKAKEVGCDIFLNTDAGAVSAISPVVTMSRDMLSYEPGEIERYGWSKARLRLYLLRLVQNRSLRRSNGVIFLTRYAARVIQESCGPLDNVSFIPHGVGSNFVAIKRKEHSAISMGDSLRLIYVSNADLYKHQWKVIEATEMLRKQGINVSLTLVGGGDGLPQKMLMEQKDRSDPLGEFIFQKHFVPHSELPSLLAQADIFVFASSCENMPNTLVEAMASGLPIACSNRGPMPEVLEDAGVYFDPEESTSIAQAIKSLAENKELREKLADRSKALSAHYSWERCAKETWAFLSKTLDAVKAGK